MTSERQGFDLPNPNCIVNSYNIKPGDVCLVFTQEGVLAIAPDLCKPNCVVGKHVVLALAIVRLLAAEDDRFDAAIADTMTEIIRASCVPAKPM